VIERNAIKGKPHRPALLITMRQTPNRGLRHPDRLREARL